jgi:hypothetical protein
MEVTMDTQDTNEAAPEPATLDAGTACQVALEQMIKSITQYFEELRDVDAQQLQVPTRI